jgi:hypothetical protein
MNIALVFERLSRHLHRMEVFVKQSLDHGALVLSIGKSDTVNKYFVREHVGAFGMHD